MYHPATIYHLLYPRYCRTAHRQVLPIVKYCPSSSAAHREVLLPIVQVLPIIAVLPHREAFSIVKYCPSPSIAHRQVLPHRQALPTMQLCLS